jgi:N-acetylglucosamine-6-phosphate deacetylase
MDQLVFNQKLSLVDKVKYKTILVKHLTRVVENIASINESIDKINESLADKISKLNEEQVKVLNLFAENNESTINGYYTTLIENTQNMVEETINKADDIIVVKKLLEVRSKLNGMKSQKPSLEVIDNILDLKKSFE